MEAHEPRLALILPDGIDAIVLASENHPHPIVTVAVVCPDLPLESPEQTVRVGWRVFPAELRPVRVEIYDTIQPRCHILVAGQRVAEIGYGLRYLMDKPAVFRQMGQYQRLVFIGNRAAEVVRRYAESGGRGFEELLAVLLAFRALYGPRSPM